MAIFETVWQTVNDGFYDPDMNGVDWQAIHDQYEPQIAAAPDAEAYYRQLNKMLFELGVSHIAILPSTMVDQLETITFAPGTVGIDIRMIDKELVITAVQPDFPAAQASLQPGYIITAVNNKTTADFDAEALHSPPYNPQNERAETTQAVRTQIYGDIGSSITLSYLDEANQPGETTLTFTPRPGKQGEITEGLPSSFVELESRILDDNISYLRFSGFLPAVLEDALTAIDDKKDTPGLIIDLRGNPGGVFYVRKALAEKLVGQRILFWRYQQRHGLETVYLDTVEDPYQGLLVILIDELSASSSEEFAGGLQAIGRATIVGEQSPGRCLIAEILPLNNSDILVYPHGQSQTANGAVLEGNGVTPDVIVSLDRESLLHGDDRQLNAAIQLMLEQIKTQP